MVILSWKPLRNWQKRLWLSVQGNDLQPRTQLTLSNKVLVEKNKQLMTDELCSTTLQISNKLCNLVPLLLSNTVYRVYKSDGM